MGCIYYVAVQQERAVQQYHHEYVRRNLDLTPNIANFRACTFTNGDAAAICEDTTERAIIHVYKIARVVAGIHEVVLQSRKNKSGRKHRDHIPNPRDLVVPELFSP